MYYICIYSYLLCLESQYFDVLKYMWINYKQQLNFWSIWKKSETKQTVKEDPKGFFFFKTYYCFQPSLLQKTITVILHFLKRFLGCLLLFNNFRIEWTVSYSVFCIASNNLKVLSKSREQYKSWSKPMGQESFAIHFFDFYLLVIRLRE